MKLKGKAFESLGLGSGGNNNLLHAVLEMLNNRETGGLPGMVQALQQKGLGDIISSWISRGETSLFPRTMLHGIGADKIHEIAEKAGVSQQNTASQLTALLPGIIDKLTPDGKIPDGNLLEKGLEILKGKL
jgi:uncharacterized protein YidB (DUF937 family)